MELNEENVNFIHTTKSEENFFSFKNLALTIIPSNNSQTNDRNVMKICFYAICEVNFTISLRNFRVYIEKN